MGFKRVKSDIFSSVHDDFHIEIKLECEFFSRNDEVCFVETEVRVVPEKQGFVGRLVQKELGMRLAEAVVNIKPAFEFERMMVLSKYEYLLRHRAEHPEAY